MTKITEDTITESAFTKMTSYVLGSDMIITIYNRYGVTDKWEFADDYRMTMEEFESMKDTMVYLAMKYKHDIKQEQQ